MDRIIERAPLLLIHELIARRLFRYGHDGIFQQFPQTLSKRASRPVSRCYHAFAFCRTRFSTRKEIEYVRISQFRRRAIHRDRRSF
jgi:hypothetical protein